MRFTINLIRIFSFYSNVQHVIVPRSHIRHGRQALRGVCVGCCPPLAALAGCLAALGAGPRRVLGCPAHAQKKVTIFAGGLHN